MSFELHFAKGAARQFADLQKKAAAKHLKVVKWLRKLSADPKQTGLNSHKYVSMRGPTAKEYGKAMSKTTLRVLGESSGATDRAKA